MNDEPPRSHIFLVEGRKKLTGPYLPEGAHEMVVREMVDVSVPASRGPGMPVVPLGTLLAEDGFAVGAVPPPSQTDRDGWALGLFMVAMGLCVLKVLECLPFLQLRTERGQPYATEGSYWHSFISGGFSDKLVVLAYWVGLGLWAVIGLLMLIPTLFNRRYRQLGVLGMGIALTVWAVVIALMSR